MDNRIKIAYLDYSQVFAGAERVLHTIIDNLDRKRFEPTLVFPYPMEHQSGYADLDCDKICLADRKTWWMGSARWKHPLRGTDLLARSVWGIKLAGILKSRKIDILHVNLLRPDVLMWILPAKLAGIKIIGHFRSQSYEWITPLAAQKCCKLILCVSRYSQNRMLHKGNHTPSMTLYDSIEIEQFQTDLTQIEARKKLGLPTNGTIFSSVGQLSRHKGHDNAIRSFATIADLFPDTYLYVAGGGADLEYLQNMAKSYPAFKDRIFFSGKQLSDVKTVYRASDIILSLTKVGEAFGLVPYEASIMGLPFIAPNFGAVTEFINDGVNGCLVDTNSVEAISAKMEWLLTNPELAKKMVKEAQATISESLTPETMVNNLQEAYDSVIRGRIPQNADLLP
ncbi:glycosyltransferase family 4 protein [Bacteroides acidifaciens]|uniref:glycosyltransferase family 4 protein n=1 Tax=Bacteroides acidifaciens TaxID=85831 RepID=UPI0025992C01|nr:glycosyltransferase family 4 protein [Bacteroides acidifaciens]